MIILKNFRIEEEADTFAATCDLIGDGFPSQLTFRTPHANHDAIDIDEPNWAAMALLYPAMLLGQDLVIEADLSPRLLYNIRNDLGSLLNSYEPLAKRINIEAGMTSASPLTQDRDVATGFSGGVDSLATTMLYGGPEVHESMRLNALATFNVGALGPTAEVDDLFKNAQARVSEYAAIKGWNTYFVAADLDQIYGAAKHVTAVDFVKTMGFRNAAAALLLQKGVKAYLPSSSGVWSNKSCGPNNYTGHLDPVLLPLLATEGLWQQSAGVGLDRIDKIEILSDHPDAQARLDVCVSPPAIRRASPKINCSHCWKCVPTMLVLEALGKLDDFDQVFDVAYYQKHRTELLRKHSVSFWRQGRPRTQLKYAEAHGLSVPYPNSKFEWFTYRVINKLKRMIGLK